jgi:hypothetical protein
VCKPPALECYLRSIKVNQILYLFMFQQSKGWEVQEGSAKKFMRPKSSSNIGPRPRPKTIHLSEVDSSGSGAKSSHGKVLNNELYHKLPGLK